MPFISVAATIAATIGAYALFTLLKVLHQEFTSPLRHVPGPKSDHWFLGNRQQLSTNMDGQEGLWTAQYGRTVRINTFLGFSQLYTTDNKAVQHILSNTYLYQKPASGRYFLGRVVGPGVLVVEEDVHKKQRKVMNPAFGPAQLRALTEIFVEKSKQLRDLWSVKVAQAGGVARVDVIPEFSTAALDIIGKAGFNYDFHSMGGDSESIRDELHEAFATISAAGKQTGILDVLKAHFPLLRCLLPSTRIDKVIEGSQTTMRVIGQRLLHESRQNISAGSSADSAASRDLLSLLVRANMSKDVSEAQRLSEEDVLAQVPTFLVAGHETTAATWAFFELAKNAHIQMRLRNELLEVDTDNPSMDDLNALPFLDCVVRETLRAHAPVTAILRVAMRDDVITLETPYIDRSGAVHDTIRLTKGQSVVVPILAMNRDSTIWGPDADQFVPERWERKPAISTSLPGLWSQMLTFIGGPRACIGFRFSLVELKALLFTLVRGLEFELAVPAADIGRRAMSIVQQPILRSEAAAGSQMPILIKALKDAEL
ncbi:cytochrome P450 [Mycena albidolilacea]|uniref:Cytochrome P450 n=1 Tax=Mycena albidolilacea TaxID=1033008 RepID=A0AAD6ZMC3_9AGAR|nr:cytochrome P450 [Mycena albidolilacea]